MISFQTEAISGPSIDRARADRVLDLGRDAWSLRVRSRTRGRGRESALLSHLSRLDGLGVVLFLVVRSSSSLVEQTSPWRRCRVVPVESGLRRVCKGNG